MKGIALKSHLDEYRKSGKFLPIDLLKKWSMDLIDGISAINLKMLHRDLKPDNLLIDNGTLKISDFGLSKVIGAATRTNSFKGHQQIFYMAPEGWNLETNAIQIDMYAVGIILFEMASLEYPYTITRFFDVDAIRKVHLFQPPKSLRELRSDLPVEFYHLVTRLMEKRANDRYANWQDAKMALEKAWLSQGRNGQTRKDSIVKLLEQAERLHQTKTSKQLELEKLAAKQKEKHQLDEYQYEELVKAFRGFIREFNDRSSLGEIREQPGLVFVLPLSNSPKPKTVQLTFFDIDPPLNLKVGWVSYAATLEDTGFPRLSFLLCREDENDLYGKWVVCESRSSALVSPDKKPRYPFDTFGFRDHEIREIERADRAMHTFETEFDEDIEGTFFRVLSESMDRI